MGITFARIISKRFADDESFFSCESSFGESSCNRDFNLPIPRPLILFFSHKAEVTGDEINRDETNFLGRNVHFSRVEKNGDGTNNFQGRNK